MRDGVLKSGYTSAIFVDMGAKVDGTYYNCDLLLSQQFAIRLQEHWQEVSQGDEVRAYTRTLILLTRISTYEFI